MERNALYRTIWRWHFYAGLLVMPFIVILSLSGAVYLFKPQIDRWEERAFQNLSVTRRVSAGAQVDAALHAVPEASFVSYRLPRVSEDAALVEVALVDGTRKEVFVAPDGQVLGQLDPERRIAELVSAIHGQLLLGKAGSWLVELAACWAIVMILTGLYLWWPRDVRGPAGIVWPRIGAGRRALWRDLHAVTGFWVSGLALVLLVSGLPWAGVWGEAFKLARTELGLIGPQQDWTIGGKVGAGNDGHHHEAEPKRSHMPMASLSTVVDKAEREQLAFPVVIKADAAHGAWLVKSEAQNRPLRVSIGYDATGEIMHREAFSDRHLIDRVVGYGIAWHEGQLFGWVNQLVGVVTAAALVMLAVSGFVMWRRRKPKDALGALPLPQVPARMGGVVAILFVLAVLLPLFTISLLLLALLEWLLFCRIPALRVWLGLPVRSTLSA